MQHSQLGHLRFTSWIVLLTFLSFGRPAPAAETPFAWQSLEAYRPPNFEDTFPDNPEGGKRLEMLLPALERGGNPLVDPFDLLREGLRALRADRQMPALRWFGNAFIWNQSPQDPRAIELMYHAAGSTNSSIRYNAVYFGLSVVRPLTDPILRTMVDLAIDSEDPNLLSRIAWGAASHKERLMHYLQPHLESPDPARRIHAQALRRIFSGELEAFAWARENTRRRAGEKYAERLGEFWAALARGDSATRIDTLNLIQKDGIALIMDDSFIEAFTAAARDPDVRVRKQIATIAGSRWIWNASAQAPQAIDLMMLLSRDLDREVRYSALYFGLSTVQNQTDAVLERLLELAMKDAVDNPNTRHRIIWGLRKDSESVRRVLEKWMADRESSTIKALFAHGFHLDFFSEPSKPGEPLERLLATPDRQIAHLLAFQPTSGWQGESMEEFLTMLSQELPPGYGSRLLWTNNQAPPFLILEDREVPVIKRAVLASPHFKVAREIPLSVAHILGLGKEGRLNLEREQSRR